MINPCVFAQCSYLNSLEMKNIIIMRLVILKKCEVEVVQKYFRAIE